MSHDTRNLLDVGPDTHASAGSGIAISFWFQWAADPAV